MPRTAYAIDADRQLQVDVLTSAAPPAGASATEVQGTAAVAAAPVGDPVFVASRDIGGNIRNFKMDTAGALQVAIESAPAAGPSAIAVQGNAADGGSPTANGNLFLGAGSDGAAIRALRVVDTNKTALSTGLAVNTDLAVWTPASGKKFRLRRITITATGLTAGDVIEVRDSATVIRQYVVQGTTFQVVEGDDANGILSAAANNVLNVRHVTTAASIRIAVNVSGNEE